MSSNGRLTVLQSAASWLPQTQTWMYQQTRFLPDDVETHVVCDRTENLDQFGVPNIHCWSTAPFVSRAWTKGLRLLGLRSHPYLVKVARRVGARIVHSHFGHIGWRDGRAAGLAGARHVVTFYGRDLGYMPRSEPRWKERYQAMFAEVDRVLCEGPHMAGEIMALGCPEEKAVVHHLGIDLDVFEYRPRTWDGSGPLRVLLAGSFTEKKGLPYAIEALGRVKEAADVRVTIIGGASARPEMQREKQRILDAIRHSGLGERVRLLGYQTYERLLAEAYEHDVFLSPSVRAADGDTEGGAPVTILEMAATGMPVVSTRHADIPEVLPEGAGLLAEERDPEGLAAHLRHLIEHPESWAPLTRAARDHLESEYDVRTQAARLADLYRSLA